MKYQQKENAFNKALKKFESLKYSDNAGARFVSRKDAFNFSKVSAPTLEISWNPRGGFAHEGSTHFHLNPRMGDIWSAYTSQSKEDKTSQNWRLDMGIVTIVTTDSAFGTHLELSYSDIIVKLEIGDGRSTPSEAKTFIIRPQRPAQANAILRSIKHWHSGAIIGLKKKLDFLREGVAQPLNKKSIVFANVPGVHIMPESVVIPFLPKESIKRAKVAGKIKAGLEYCLANGLPLPTVKEALLLNFNEFDSEQIISAISA